MYDVERSCPAPGCRWKLLESTDTRAAVADVHLRGASVDDIVGRITSNHHATVEAEIERHVREDHGMTPDEFRALASSWVAEPALPG